MLSESSIFDPDTGFGGNGVGGMPLLRSLIFCPQLLIAPADDDCVTNGPFKNLRLRMTTESVYHLNQSNTTDYCLYRGFDQASWETTNRSNIEECFVMETYERAWSCYNGYPHGAGHGAVGGLVS